MSRPGPEWRRLLRSAAAAMERERRTCSIADPSTAERHLVSGITGRYRGAAVKTLRVELAALDAYVEEAFGSDLASLVRAELGVEIGAARRRRRERVEGIERLLAEAGASPLSGADWFAAWLESLRSAGVLADLVAAGEGLGPIVRVLEALPADDVPLPVLGERLLGDTKALAAGRARTMLVRALALWRGIESPEDAEAERELLEWAGVVSDDIASQVLVLNVPVEGGPVGEWMRAARGVPFRLTLQQLRIAPVAVTAPVLRVVENPSIVRAASDALGRACPPLVCTEGVPSAALYRLLGTAGGARVLWRADFDWAGVRIVRRGLERFGNAEPWRMSAADYRAGAPGIGLRGKETETPWDPVLREAMSGSGRSVMEESLLPVLLEDLRRGAGPEAD